MKKILTIITLVAGCVASTYGQGTVIFATTASASTKFSTNSVAGGALTSLAGGTAGEFYFALFYASNGTNAINGSSGAVRPGAGSLGKYVFSDSNWSFLYAGTNSSGGKFSGVQNADGTVTVPGITAASTASLVALGWSATLGSTLAQLEASLASGVWNGNGYIGQSAVANIILGGGTQGPVSLFGSSPGQVGGLGLGMVSPVPEPATFALAGLGAAAMLIFRRRK